ncbi:putative Syntaxin-52 [Cocos nucifera]|nr:putative Syntaxin-52 [Cocos nucifera]
MVNSKEVGSRVWESACQKSGVESLPELNGCAKAALAIVDYYHRAVPSAEGSNGDPKDPLFRSKTHRKKERKKEKEKKKKAKKMKRKEKRVSLSSFSGGTGVMGSSSDSWLRELNEASKLADDISAMISERGSLPPSGPDTQRHTSAIRRKITILGTKLDSLESLLSKLPSKQPISDKELLKRQDMLSNLRSKAKQMASTLNMSNFANREDLLGQSKSTDEINRTAGLDNYGVVGLQRQIMREQDEGLERLEETVLSTKHIALTVNEELDLHTKLIDNLDHHADLTSSRLQADMAWCCCTTLYGLVLRIPSVV